MRLFFLVILAMSVTARFTDDFYQLLDEKNADDNFISSPLSVEIVMSMAYMGAGGNTAEEMRKVLKLPADKKEVAKKYNDLLTNLKGREKVPEYNQVVRDSFKAEAQAINLRNPDEAASIVNKWVANQTHDKIHDIVKSNNLNSDTKVVLVNAIYLKGQWDRKFDPKNTKTSDFRTTDQNRVSVQMMSNNKAYSAEYFKDLDAKVIELPYRDSELSMFIFLPEKVDGLKELEKKIRGFSRPLGLYQVNLKLPKFKIEYSEDLKSILQTMGIRSAFELADFSGLVEPGNMNIGKVLHKAFIEVNEEGTEAAAATALVFEHTSKPLVLPTLNITVDHPFAYTIRDKSTIYFQGHVVNPGA